MAAEDRDQIFEKALGQHLRATGARSSTASACPDAEILAAYHERSLSAEHAATAKEHILACEHCQAVLEQLAATDAISLSVQPAQPQKAGSAGTVHVLKPRRAQIWRWVAPAGAVAAAVLVWVTVRENPRVHKSPTSEVIQTAAPAPAPPQFQSVPEAIAKAKPPNAAPLAGQLAPSARRGDTATSRMRDERNATNYLIAPSGNSEAAVPAPKRLGAVGHRPQNDKDLKSEEAELSRDIAAAEEKQKLDATTDTLQRVLPASPSREHAAAVAGGALSRPAAADRTAAPSQTMKKARAAATPSPAAPPAGAAQEQQMEGMSRFKEAPAVLLANATASTVIAAPSGSASWRIGPTGYIAHSADRGKTWAPQASGVSVDLIAGAAVSDQVCWLVGHGGTVLLTADGGAHWQRLTAPTREDLLSVSATDARQATVTVAVGSYQTTDGGVTWHKLAPE